MYLQTCDAAFSFQQIVKEEPSQVPAYRKRKVFGGGQAKGGTHTCNAALPLEQIVKEQPPYVPLLGREALKVDVDLQLHVLPHRPDALRRLVLAQKVLLAP